MSGYRRTNLLRPMFQIEADADAPAPESWARIRREATTEFVEVLVLTAARTVRS